MVAVVEPELLVEPIDELPGERRVVVRFGVEVPPDDPLLGAHAHVEAVVTAIDEQDAPVFPADLRLHLRSDLVIDRPGTIRLALATDVHRVDLDVEQDWWRINDGGGFEPIAEFADHLFAHVTVVADGRIAASAETPTVTGSWGALGAD